VTWNPHKLMGALLQCSAILVRHKVSDLSTNELVTFSAALSQYTDALYFRDPQLEMKNFVNFFPAEIFIVNFADSFTKVSLT